jgi:hypothetical protein
MDLTPDPEKIIAFVKANDGCTTDDVLGVFGSTSEAKVAGKRALDELLECARIYGNRDLGREGLYWTDLTLISPASTPGGGFVRS